jgi:acetyl-CoA carboxylase alpha subunit
MEQIVEQAVLHAAQQLEDQLDHQLHQMDNMGEDDMEQLRRKRMMVCLAPGRCSVVRVLVR